MKYSSFLLRITAGVLDILIFFFGGAILYLLSTRAFGEWLGATGQEPSNIAIIIFNLIEIPLLFIYFIYLPAKRGAAFGGTMVVIKYVDDKGKTPSLSKLLIRETIGRFISSLSILGYLWMLWDRKRQTWHDKIAGTYVVNS